MHEVARPGCFGHVVTYQSYRDVCDICQHNADCSESVQNRLESIKSLKRYPELAKLLPGHTDALSESERVIMPAPRPTSQPDTGESLVMTKKAKAVYQTLTRKGVDLKMGLLTRVNPVITPVFVRVAYDMLLKEGGYSKWSLKKHYQKEMDWSEATAASHVGMVTSLFKGVGIVDEDGDQVTTRKML